MEYNKKYDSIIRDYNDPENEVHMRYWLDYKKAQGQVCKAKDELEKCDTALLNIFLLCEKIKNLLNSYCSKVEFSKNDNVKNFDIDNVITTNSASENIATNNPIDVSKRTLNINENHTYISLDFLQRLYPLICNYSANYLNRKEVNLEP